MYETTFSEFVSQAATQGGWQIAATSTTLSGEDTDSLHKKYTSFGDYLY